MLATLAVLRDEAAVLDEVGRRRRWPRRGARSASTSTSCRPRSRGSSLQRLADERLAGGPSIAAHVDAIVALARRPGPRLARPARRSARHLRVRARQDRAGRARPPSRCHRRCSDPRPGRVRRRRAACPSGDRSRSPTARSPRTRWRHARGPRRGGRATGCARSGWAARSRCRTCSPTARSRASARAPAARGGLRRGDRVGARAWRPGSGFASDRKPGPGCGWPGA